MNENDIQSIMAKMDMAHRKTLEEIKDPAEAIKFLQMMQEKQAQDLTNPPDVSKVEVMPDLGNMDLAGMMSDPNLIGKVMGFLDAVQQIKEQQQQILDNQEVMNHNINQTKTLLAQYLKKENKDQD